MCVDSKRLEMCALIADTLILVDSLLLLCGHYLRRGIKVGVIRDSVDDLLDIRGLLVGYIEELSDEE